MISNPDPKFQPKPPFHSTHTFKVTVDGTNGKPLKPALLIDAVFKIEGFAPVNRAYYSVHFGLNGGNGQRHYEQRLIDYEFICARPVDKVACVQGWKEGYGWDSVEVVFREPREE
ncbi:hypothetical protein J1614_001537 [Plenodomus biglobosus]|nr:hypothetical protein J1614_001537 [Plenodomus biglobosus]